MCRRVRPLTWRAAASRTDEHSDGTFLFLSVFMHLFSHWFRRDGVMTTVIKIKQMNKQEVHHVGIKLFFCFCWMLIGRLHSLCLLAIIIIIIIIIVVVRPPQVRADSWLVMSGGGGGALEWSCCQSGNSSVLCSGVTGQMWCVYGLLCCRNIRSCELHRTSRTLKVLRTASCRNKNVSDIHQEDKRGSSGFWFSLFTHNVDGLIVIRLINNQLNLVLFHLLRHQTTNITSLLSVTERSAEDREGEITLETLTWPERHCASKHTSVLNMNFTDGF